MSLFQLGDDHDAAAEAFELALNYYDHLGLDLGDVAGSTAAHVRAAARDTADREDDLHHTGDSLHLLAAAQRRLGQPAAAMAYLHATRFYTAASAWRSAVSAGQEAMDEQLALGDPQGARYICENLLLPIVTSYQLSDLLVPLRAQYAVILAWCGEFDAARAEMSALEAFRVDDPGALELANQRALIEWIAAEGHLPSAED